MPDLSIDRIRSLLDYDPVTGLFSWKESTYNRTRVRGQIAGKPRKSGYPMINIDNYPYLAHRLVWAIMNGRFPDNSIDHIDGDKNNNKWENLRECSGTQNNGNMKIGSRNKSGWKGVSWSPSKDKWYSTIQKNKKSYNLGYYDDAREAAEEYMFAALEMFGEFARGR